LASQGRTFVVEAGQSPVLEFLGSDVGMVEPGIAQTDEFAGCIGDGFDARIGFF
jgi:hypothetical protein